MRGRSRWLAAFPRSWRTRYGEELATLIEELAQSGDLRAIDKLDLIRSGLRMRRGHLRRVTFRAAGVAALVASTITGLALSGALSTPSPIPPSHATAPALSPGPPATHVTANLLPVYRLLCAGTPCSTKGGRIVQSGSPIPEPHAPPKGHR
jgi:hypothetical protein